MSEVVAILREDFCRGFSLAGVRTVSVVDPRGLRAALDAAITEGSCGMAIVEEEMMRELPEEARAEYAAVTVPLIIEVSGAMLWREEKGVPLDDYVARLVRRAVGYQLNIKL